MQSVRAMRAEVFTPEPPPERDAGWGRIVFIGIVCALGGFGFLAATVVMNPGTLSYYSRLRAPAPAPVETPSKVPDVPVAVPAKPKAPVNDRFQPVDFATKGNVNKAALARCRSHIEAGKPFEALSLNRAATFRDLNKSADSEAICLDYLRGDGR